MNANNTRCLNLAMAATFAAFCKGCGIVKEFKGFYNGLHPYQDGDLLVTMDVSKGTYKIPSVTKVS